jgi:hypothetical protein
MAMQACPVSWPGLNAVLGGDGATKIVTTIHSTSHRDAKTNTILPPLISWTWLRVKHLKSATILKFVEAVRFKCNLQTYDSPWWLQIWCSFQEKAKGYWGSGSRLPTTWRTSRRKNYSPVRSFPKLYVQKGSCPLSYHGSYHPKH